MLQPRIYTRAAILTLTDISTCSRCVAAHPLLRRLASSKATAAANLRSRKQRPSPPITAAASATTPVVSQLANDASTSDAAALSASSNEGAVHQREMYSFDTSTLPDVRLLLSAGAAIFALLINYADIIRRDPPVSIPAEGDDVSADTPPPQPAWRRYTLSIFLVSAGTFVFGWSIWWPSRNIARLTLISQSPLPTTQFISQGRILTPYHACDVRLESQGSVFSKRLFPPRLIPFTKLRLLGPLSNEQKAWHPIDSAAFKKRKGRFPVTVPLAIYGERATYTLRRIAGRFRDPEGLERALLQNEGRASESQ